jgi:hypothetical protein
MPKTPTALPLFATDGDPAAIVEPLTDTIAAGFAPDERPPAGWINWLFHAIGLNIDALRGPSRTNWARVTTTVKIREADYDDVTPDGATPRHRIVGIDDSNDPQVWASVHGDSWLQRDVNPVASTGEPRAIVFNGTVWVLGTDDGAGGGLIWTTTPDGVGGSSITTEGTNWSATTLPASTAPVLTLAADKSTGVLVAGTDDAVMYSTDDGATWASATFSGARTGLTDEVVFTGSAWLAITSTGEIWRASDPAGTWSKVADLSPTAGWRMTAAGPTSTDAGTVVAYRADEAAAEDWYRSDDDGATWALATAPTAYVQISRLRYVDDAWWIVSTAWPYLAAANDLDANEWRTLPIPYLEGGEHRLLEVLAADAGVLALGFSHTLTSLRAHYDPAGPFVPATGAAPIYDAGYLRGRVVDDAAPTDHDVLAWDDAGDAWAPEGPGARLRVQTTATSATVGAKAAVVWVTSTAAPRTITLPAPSVDRAVLVKDTSNNAAVNNITVDTPGAETIDGAATYVINVNRGWVHLSSDGTNWAVIGAGP